MLMLYFLPLYSVTFKEQQSLLTLNILTHVRDLVRTERTFSPNLEGLMALRRARQEEIYKNILEKRPAMSFPAETQTIRDGDWKSETHRPPNMADRACENTHPSRAANMAIHGLNSKAASDFMDNEDSQAPLKANVLAGYRTIYEAVCGTIKDVRPNSKTVLKGRLSPQDLEPFSSNADATFQALQEAGVLNGHGRITDLLCEPDFVLEENVTSTVTDLKGLDGFLRERRPATIQVRVRGLHMLEGHFLVDGKPVSAPLLDFAVFVATCHAPLAAMAAQPTLYLPKMESRHETAWWAKVFAAMAAQLGIPPKAIRSTTMIETITASMEKEEMNYTLREHSLGQNKGRYDYLFNFIKRLTLPKSLQANLSPTPNNLELVGTHAPHRRYLLPDNAHTGMGVSFLEAYSNHTSQVNLRRGFDSVGGMVTNIPTGDPAIDKKAQAKLRVDKTNEAWKGDAGGWSGHPAFSPYVREPFDIVRALHRGLAVLAKQVGEAKVRGAIKGPADPASIRQALADLVASISVENGGRESETLAAFLKALETSLSLHVAANAAQYQDGLLRFIRMEPPSPDVKDHELIEVPADQHTPDKFTYAGLKQYLRLALFYTASFIHGTGCIALDGVFEDLATAEKARVNVWQWLTLDQPLMLSSSSSATLTPALLAQAMEEVYHAALHDERGLWGAVCKSVPPMQPDSLAEKHFRVARKVLMILMTNDRCIEFIPDLAYPFLLDPVREDDKLWAQVEEGLDAYADPMTRYVVGKKEV